MVGSSSVTDGVCVGRPLSTFAGVVPVVGSSDGVCVGHHCLRLQVSYLWLVRPVLQMGSV